MDMLPIKYYQMTEPMFDFALVFNACVMCVVFQDMSMTVFLTLGKVLWYSCLVPAVYYMYFLVCRMRRTRRGWCFDIKVHLRFVVAVKEKDLQLQLFGPVQFGSSESFHTQ